MPTCVLPAGRPRRSVISFSHHRCPVVHTLPSPRAGRTEPHADAASNNLRFSNRVLLRVTTDSQTVGGMLPSALARKEAFRAGVTAALTERDSGFGDYRVGERCNGGEAS
jgi:hypothetical protein